MARPLGALMWKGISDAMKTNGMAPTRRAFTVGSSARAGGVILAPHPISSVAAQLTTPSDEPKGDSEITAWIVIEPDDPTIIRVARSEMGQGNFPALPMVVAEEVECDWRFVHPEYIEPSENIARDHAWGDMTTAASLSVRGQQSYLQKPGPRPPHTLKKREGHR